MDHLILIGAGRMGRPYVEAAHRLGFRVTILESPERARDYPDERVVLVDPSTTDEAWAAAALAAAAADPPDGVLPFNETQVLAAALLQERYALPGPGLLAATVSRNKGLQRALFSTYGIPQPEFRTSSNAADADAWVLNHLPVIAKPLDGSGSVGVQLVADRDGWLRYQETLGADSKRVYESRVDGDEFSWEAIVSKGRPIFTNITAKTTTGPPHFVETEQRVPALLSQADEERAAHLGVAVTRALRVDTALVHLEFRLSPHGPAVMEVATRTPGDFILDLINDAYGIDCHELLVRLAMGEPMDALTAPPQRTALSWFATAKPGRVRFVSGLDTVRDLEHVVDAQVIVAEGSVLAPTRSSLDRVGWVRIVAPNRDALEGARRAAQTRLHVDTESVAATPERSPAGLEPRQV